MKLHEIRELIRLVDQSSIDELELENGGVQVLLKKAQRIVEQTVQGPAREEDISYGEAAITAEAPEIEPVIQLPTEATGSVSPPVKQVEIVSPWVGVFTNPGISVGERVEIGQVVCNCNVDTLKLFHEIKSSVSGEVIEILADEGQLIEYGQPLFVIKAD